MARKILTGKSTWPILAICALFGIWIALLPQLCRAAPVTAALPASAGDAGLTEPAGADLILNQTGERGVRNAALGRWYVSLQAAIDDPQTLAGHTLVIPEGTYSGSVILSKPLTIVGAGLGKTILRAAADGMVITVSGVTISNTTFAGSGAGYGITTSYGITNVSILNNEIHDFDVGVQLNGGFGHLVKSNVLMTLTTAGVALFGTSPALPLTGTRIQANEIVNSDIAVWGAFVDGNTVLSNTMRNGAAGVRLASANGNTVERNTIVDNTAYGIYFSQGLPPQIPNSYSNGGNLITGNVILRNPDRGIQLLHSDPVSDNHIINNVVQVTDEGIFFTTGERRLVVQGNRITGYSAPGIDSFFNDGIYIARSIDITISDNVISGALGTLGGIVILDSNLVRLNGNSLVANASAGLYVVGVTELTASNNTFRDHAVTAIFLHSPGTTSGVLGGTPARSNVFRNNSLNITTTLPADNPVIDATHNDWGVTALGAIEATIYHVVDNPSLAEMRYFELRQQASNSTIRANSISRSQITTTLLGLISPTGNTIAFSTTLGSLSRLTGTTQPNSVTTTLTSTIAGVANVSARLSYQVVTTTIVIQPSVPTTIEMRVSPVLTVPGGSSRITATVLDQGGDVVLNGTPVTLTTGLGTLSPTVAGTLNGVVTTSISSGVMGLARVTATVGSVRANAFVFFLVDIPMTVTLQVSPTTIIAGEPVALTATVKNSSGQVVTDGTPVLFVTNAGATPAYTVGIVTGGVVTTTIRSTVAGLASITAICGQAQDSEPLTILPGPVATVWITATPDIIAADGISASLILVDLRDQFSNRVPGVQVSLLASPGSITPVSATSGALGQITATLTSTVPGVGTVWAIAGEHIGATTVTFVQSPSSVEDQLAGSLVVVTQTSSIDGMLRKGDTITYTLTVTNAGIALVKDLLLVAPVPAGTQYIDPSASGGVPVGGDLAAWRSRRLRAPLGLEDATAIIWSGELPPGASHTITYAVRITLVVGAINNQPLAFVGIDQLSVSGLGTVSLNVEPSVRWFLPMVSAEGGLPLP